MKILFCGIVDARQECGIDFAIQVLQLIRLRPRAHM